MPQQVAADLGPGVRVICSTPTTSTIFAAPARWPDALMHRCRSGRAGVFDPRRRLEAQLRIGLQHQRCGKILRREAGVEVPEHDLIDVGSGNAGVGERVV
jgi:hypothetical protein